MNPVTDYDVDILARTVMGEARGEGFQGMLAVAYVAVNRATIASQSARKQFGTGSIATACLAAEQFSCWNPGDPNRQFIKLANLDMPIFRLAYLAALTAITGHEADPTEGAVGYWNPDKVSPPWAEGKDYVSIGHHRFIKDI